MARLCRLAQFARIQSTWTGSMNVHPKVRPIRVHEGRFEPVQAALNAAQALQSGQVIATPTDTIYGLAALAQNREAVQKLYQIKGRHADKPIAICVGQIEDIYTWSEVTVARAVLERLLPGPVTVIFRRKPELNLEFNPGTDLVGIRIPDHPFILAVCHQAQGPVALTSANVSSAPSTLAVEEFAALFPELHSVYDGGRISDTEEARLGSTVVDLSEPGSYRLVRPGSARLRTVKVLEKIGLTPR
ncbi:threonylcarbamoyl-AMP synthase-like [Tigriopus californicus]|uniref:threonylcarbamoyl-AMP synthase-like n=1 Tax=Tigriopus californicus TaxID=6832 RepID=UPI0027DA0773|nr:threonylcarbamoyl-AMP synthase-like [Tigriopus californicus]